MALITLGRNTISSTAATVNAGRRLTYIRGPIGGQASVSAAVVRIQSARSTEQAVATTAVGGRLIKYVKGGLTVQASSVADSRKYKTVRGALLAQATLEAYTADRDIKRDMNDYLPKYYSDFEQVAALMQTKASEKVRLQAKLRELLDQFYVETATYGLDRWESLAEIKHIPPRSTDSRRKYLNGKLRGTGTVTPELMGDIVNAFYKAEVREKPAENKVAIKLVGKRGVPKNLEDIEDAVGDVIPAHLAQEYEFTYLPWREVSEAGLTWAQADQLTLKHFEEAFLIEGGASNGDE